MRAESRIGGLVALLLPAAAAVIALGPGCGSLSPSPSAPAGRVVAKGRIAFAEYLAGDVRQKKDIWVMGENGSTVVNLTRHEADDDYPVWGERGQWLFFVSTREGNEEIYIMKSDEPGGNATNLTKNSSDDTCPAWSPDQENLAFLSDRGGALAIYVGPMGSEKARRVTKWFGVRFGGLELNWLPGGAGFGSHTGNHQIATVNAEGSDFTTLTPDGLRDWKPAWSPDGRRIAFCSDPRGIWNIHVMDADGKNRRNLTENNNKKEGYPCWSPDGKKIAFVAFPGEIWVMNADGSDRKLLLDRGRRAWISHLAWAMDR